MKHLNDDVPGAVAKGDDWPTCCCCGTDDMRDDSMQCEACERFGCGETNVGEPCPREEKERHDENARKARLYDDAISGLRNALARLDALTAERDAAWLPYEAADTSAPDFAAKRDAYQTAAERVRGEAFCVVGTAEAILRRGGAR